ncbi:MAG: DUF5119 domain-containing protein [Bacteroidaceae bacterium]
MKYFKQLLSVAMLLLVITACQRDHLYYGTNDRAIVKVNIDWKKSQMTPNGATVMAYNKDGSLFKVFPPMSDPNGGTILLPQGSYDLIIFNDTPNEYKHIGFRGMENINTFEAYAFQKEASKNRPKFQGDVFVYEPDTLATARINNLEVTSRMVEYYYDKPNDKEMQISKEIKATPQRVTSLMKIKVHVKGLCYAKGAPRTYLRNMSASTFIGTGLKSTNPVAHEFILNNRQFDEGSTQDATITNNLSTFGLLPTKVTGNRYYLDMLFTLINGKAYPISVDITDKIHVTEVEIQTILDMKLDIELPKTEGVIIDGAFEPDVTEWEDVKVEIQM